MELYECRSVAEEDFGSKREILFLSAENNEEESYETFDNRNFGYNRKFTGIRIMSGAVVDAIQFVYNTNECTPWYGGAGGTLSEFNFKEGEYITRVDWVMGMWEDYPLEVVAQITFQTNLGRKFSAGNKDKCRNIKSHYFQAEEGTYYHSFAGKYDRYLLGFSTAYYRLQKLLRFDDTLYVQNMLRVTEVRLNAGWVVDGIQLVYDGNKEAHYHGGMGGTRHTLQLQDDEYITSISGKTGNYQYQGADTLCTIEIRTNKGHSLTGGTMDGCRDMKDFSYTAKAGEQIFALSGDYSGYMRSIAVGMYALQGETPETDADELEVSSSKAGRNLLEGSASLASTTSIEGLQGGSLTEAVKGGCFEEDAMRSMLEKTLTVTESGSQCDKQLKIRTGDIIESNVTKKFVNTPQYVFRGATIAGEQKYIMENRKLLSKAQKRGVKYEPVIDKDKQNTEQYEYSTILRTLSIKTSAEPPSQFVSHAVDYKTAEAFAKPGTNVYAYKIIPDSPLLGLKGQCEVGGEDQFQILGGTEIIKLFQFNNNHWEQYDFETKTWSQTRKHPVNKEYEKLKENDMGEL